MVGISFARPIGPYADTKELEFVSSLHQTGKAFIRQDGTINARDVMHYLCSRHGIRVEEDVVRQAIVHELAGTPPAVSKELKEQPLKLGDAKSDTSLDDDSDDDEEEEESRFDLCQVLALLMIPFLRGGNTGEMNQETVGNVVELALDTIWSELRAHSVHVAEDDKEEGVLVTTDFLREIMDIFGEFNMPEDILQEMIAAAAGDSNQKSSHFYMTKASFLQALTADTQLWNTNVDEHKSTHFDDARKAREAQKLVEKPMEEDSFDSFDKSEDSPPEASSSLPFTQLYTASNIDNTADTYRSTSWFVLVWTATVWVYVAYIGGIKQRFDTIPGCENQFGCDILKALANWSIIAVELMFYGFVWIWVSNLGNDTYPTETIGQKVKTSFRILCAMLLVIFVTVLSFFYDSKTEIWNTEKIDEFQGAYIIVMAMGLSILVLQAGRFLSIYVSLGPFTKGGQETKERRTKRSATTKTLRLIEHAALLHVCPDDSTIANSLNKSTVSDGVTEVSRQLHASGKSRDKRSRKQTNGNSTAKVLLNYSHFQDYEEESGGVLWTWKGLIDGSLLNEEGIYLHGRLIAVNAVQFLVCVFLIGYIVTLLRAVENFVEPKDDGCTFRVDGILVGSNETLVEQFASLLGGNLTDATDAYPEEPANYNFTLDALEETAVEDFFNSTLDLSETKAELRNETVALWNYIQSVGFWNVNDTHFSDSLGFVYEGQFPEWNGTAFTNGAVTVCYDFYITNGTDVWQNDVATENSFKEFFDLQKWEYTLAFSIGLIFAIGAALGISFVYIPSFVSWVLKYRSGYAPSLKGNSLTYLLYRKSPDQTAVLWGSAFWGLLASTFIVFFLFGTIAFLLIWNVSREFMRIILAQYIGIGATMAIKLVSMMLLRTKFYAGGYYRRRPAAANIMNILLEAWNLGLSIGTVTGRVVKLIVVTCFYIGRVDTPMLAPGVNFVAGANLDPAPDAFRKDLLIHEAHRHPFIERLGLLYLLKLFNGKDFGSRAGAYWRVLFVLAIFPWMRNYRIAGSTANLMTELEAELSESEEEEQDDKATNMPNVKVLGSGRVTEKLWDADDSIETLAATRRALKQQMKELNKALQDKLGDAEAVNTFNRRNSLDISGASFRSFHRAKDQVDV